jgi:asparagine synthase (glutamine-hydrolysing)
MCGIAGIVGQGFPLETVEKMSEALRHRGPDGHGVWRGEGVLLGHRRLAILDLSDAARQPMTFGPYTIVYNGEIYNYRELRETLDGPFRSDSDTEVILHLYARDGARCVDALQGMFAFAIWDERRRKLFAARDRLGIKPLYYLERGETLAFASELKAMLFVDRPPIDRSALSDYFSYKYVPAPKSIFRGIHKLPPGHLLEFDGQLRLTRYWDPDPRPVEIGEEAALERLSAILPGIVEAHTLSHVPVGVLLSGGIDSSTLVSHLSKPKTFSIGFDAQEHSELDYARLVARHFDTDHHEEQVGAVDIEEALEAIPDMYDEPYGDSSAWPTHVVSRLARKSVTVALSGDGGDELFSGYRWYGEWLGLRTSLPARWAARVLPPFSSQGRSMYKRGEAGLEQYAALVCPFTPPQKRALLAPDLLEPGYDHLHYLRGFWRDDLDPVKRLQWLDLNTYLPDDLLVKIDRAGMAVSLETRPPLLDHRLVEFALSLPSRLLRDESTSTDKLILRRNQAKYLPDEILSRPKKGFSMPVRRWMREHPGLVGGALSRLSRAGVVATRSRPRLDGEQAWMLLVLDRWMTRNGGI